MNKTTLLALTLMATLSLTNVASAAGDLGRTIFEKGNAKGAPACSGCHGMDGNGNAASGIPKLAGLHGDYIFKQLNDFRAGSRTSVMQSIVNGLSDEDVIALSQHISSLPLVGYKGGQVSDLVKQGEAIATHGLWDKDIPACARCHGEAGGGIGPFFPALAGQHASYIEAQISAWKKGHRHNDPNDLMKGIAQRLTDEEAKAVAAYYAQFNNH